MGESKRHPDLMTRAEAAELLGVSVSTLAAGWGPSPLPGYRRRVYYSRAVCEEWLVEAREQARAQTGGGPWRSTSDAGAKTNSDATTHGGRASRSGGTKSGARLAAQVAERLRSKSVASGPTTKGRHLIVVPEEAEALDSPSSPGPTPSAPLQRG